jgi:hypothetical protein
MNNLCLHNQWARWYWNQASPEYKYQHIQSDAALIVDQKEQNDHKTTKKAYTEIHSNSCMWPRIYLS